ncbi:DUF7219 family protein [Engelhardtia mirabilis]|uniref:Uncharacterized protein n=1 Tax=Engelhardtia mirabilis TaxID=2528011 RepID=A0A518BE31_9BACT|nr:hypothetical protein Pla133_01970 [Planctomycetes bacterium Pla133]QDU99459.1 hypothetical protein Pla86_01970 [Planctomycetes bacterium Pla86]
MRHEPQLPIEAGRLVFRANLREFGRRAGVLAGLADGDKMPLDQAFEDLADLWFQLERSRVGLDLDLPSER